MIALIDYGAGNLTSVRKALSHLGAEIATPHTPHDLELARGIIVPGVGHFDATRAITDEWRGGIRAAVDRGAALFGICLGMQWLFDGSSEAPGLPGFAVFAGLCTKLPSEAAQPAPTGAPSAFAKASADRHSFERRRLWKSGLLKIPHVGWNTLTQPQPTRLMAGVEQDAQVYFTHSYAAPLTAAAAATTTYGAATFTSAVEQGRIAGAQFHPEKSGDVGLRILRNWLDDL